MLGGGQLGQMAALAASAMGLEVVPYDPNPDSPAFKVTNKHFCAAWDDKNALKEFALHVDVITYEFENIPTDTIMFLMQHKSVYPDVKLLQIAQHRIAEKNYLNEIGIPTTDYKLLESEEQCRDLMDQWQTDFVILKTCRFGYDGKGQALFKKTDHRMPRLDGEVIIERPVNFEQEISVIVCRDQKGAIKTYPAVTNEHRNSILHKTIAPALCSSEIAQKAQDYAYLLAEKINLIGVLAVEFFVTKSGTLLANEIAPRPHNSGHWTIDACATSQFEQQIRAVTGLNLGEIKPFKAAEMINLIGEDISNLKAYENNDKIFIHDYQKSEIREGRKMGHVTILKD